jgi:hypothetical protein
MRDRTVELAAWILSRLGPRGESEALVGDLLEEYALRATVGSPSAALRWYLQQTCISGLYLMWGRLTRTAWLSTLAVALLAYTAVGVAEFTIRLAISHSPVTSMIVTFPMVVLIAYLAAKLRRGAPVVLGTMMLLAVTIMTLTANEKLSLGYRTAYFLVGPVAVLLGGAIRRVVARKMSL